MSEESKKRSLQKLAKCRRDYLAQAKMFTEDERAQEAAEINKTLGIKAPKGSAAATTLDTARAGYIQLLGSLGSNAEVKAEVTRFVSSSIRCNYRCWALSHANVRAEQDRPPIVRINSGPLGKLAAKQV